MSDAWLQLDGISKAFPGGQVALEGVHLSVSPGEFLSLVGPSGCGKSTLLRIIAGLMAPTSGSLCWRENPSAGQIGFVFQEPTLLPWARVWENVYLPLRLRGQSKQASADRVDQALELVGLADRRRAFPRELSGGMKMRVSIARAIVTQPKTMLMDEPFAALDEMTRFRLNDDLLRLWEEQNWTTLFVTHSVYESVYLSQRIVVMSPSPGRVRSEAPIDLPSPREESLRRTSPFAAACGRVATALREANGS